MPSRSEDRDPQSSPVNDARVAAERGAADVVAAYRYLRRSGLEERWDDLIPLLDALVAQVDAVGWARTGIAGGSPGGRQSVAEAAQHWLHSRA